MSDQALEFLRDRAEQSRDSAGVQLAQSRNTEKQIDEQIRILTDYRSLYRQRLQEAMLEGTSLQRIRDYQAFLISLDRTIENAKSSQAYQRREVERSVEVMNEHQRKFSSFNTVIDRRRNQRAVTEARVERKEQDAIATRMHSEARRSGNTYQGTD